MNVVRFLGLALIFCLSGCSGVLTQPIRYFKVETPRPFGYVIGDTIVHRIIVETRPGITLQRSSLPKDGPLNRWLNLNTVKIEAHDREGGRHYRIDLVYQVFYAPQEVKMLAVPGFNMRFNQGGQSLDQAVPDWNFTVAPLRELAVRKDQNGEYMRPDVLPPLISDRITLYRLYAGLLAMLLALSSLAYLYGYFPGMPQRSIFKRAGRRMQGLSTADIEQGLNIFHAALNSLNKQPVFKHQLAVFFQCHPQYASASEQLEWFFEYSNRYFFAGEHRPVKDDLEKIKNLCRICREIERGSR